MPLFGVFAQILHNYVHCLTHRDAFWWTPEFRYFKRIGHPCYITKADTSLR